MTRVEARPRTADTGGVGLSANSFAAIYAEHMPELTRYCRGILRDPEDAEDAAQNAMERALKALSDGPAPERMRPWLFTIAQREAFNVLRSRKRSVPTELDEAALVSHGSLEEVAAVRERLASLLSDLKELAPRQREVLVARELGGRSYRDIASDLGTTEAAAQQVVLEARQSLMHFEAGRSLECREVQSWISAHDHARVRTRRVRAHLRSCGCCRGFQHGIRGRRRDLAMLLPGIGGGGAWWSSLAALFGGGAKAAVTAGVVVVASGAALVAAPPLLSADGGLSPAARSEAAVHERLPALTARIEGSDSPAAAAVAAGPVRVRSGRRSPRRREPVRTASLSEAPTVVTTSGPVEAGGPEGESRSRPRRPARPATPEPAPEPEPTAAPAAPLAGGETLRPVSDVLHAAKPVLDAVPDPAPVVDPVTGTVTDVVEDATGKLPDADLLP